MRLVDEATQCHMIPNVARYNGAHIDKQNRDSLHNMRGERGGLSGNKPATS